MFLNTLFYFLLQGKEKYKFPNPNPFVEDDMDKNEVASVAYRFVNLPDACVWQWGRMSACTKGKQVGSVFGRTFSMRGFLDVRIVNI